MIKPVLLVHASDKSSWMHKYWYKYWLEFYGCKDIIPTVFLTETVDSKFSLVETCLTGSNLQWGEGLIQYLKQCNYNQIIYLHEDYFFTYTPVDQEEKIMTLLDIFDTYDMNLLKCCGLWAGSVDWNKPEKEPFKHSNISEKLDIDIYNNNIDYLISHQISIWNKNFLLSTLKPFYNPWQHELDGTVELRKRNVLIHAYRGELPFHYQETINRGNIIKGCEKYFKDTII